MTKFRFENQARSLLRCSITPCVFIIGWHNHLHLWNINSFSLFPRPPLNAYYGNWKAHRTIQYNPIQYSTTRSNAAQHYCQARNKIALVTTVRWSTIRSSAMQPYCLARNRTALVTTIHNATQYNRTLPSEENNEIKVIVRNDWGMALTSLVRSHANQILHITVIKPSKCTPTPPPHPFFPEEKKSACFHWTT